MTRAGRHKVGAEGAACEQLDARGRWEGWNLWVHVSQEESSPAKGR